MFERDSSLALSDTRFLTECKNTQCDGSYCDTDIEPLRQMVPFLNFDWRRTGLS